MRKILFIFLMAGPPFFFPASPVLAFQDVYRFDIHGFRLGMTAEEARKISPTMNISPVTLPEGIIGYKGKIADITLFFTAPDLGKRLFLIEKVRIYHSQPDPRPIFSALQKQYGSPDSSGRDMVRLHSCWGKCYGNHPHMVFELKVAGIRNAFPMTLKLVDPRMEDTNKRHFKGKYEK